MKKVKKENKRLIIIGVIIILVVIIAGVIVTRTRKFKYRWGDQLLKSKIMKMH